MPCLWVRNGTCSVVIVSVVDGKKLLNQVLNDAELEVSVVHDRITMSFNLLENPFNGRRPFDSRSLSPR